MPPRTRSNAPRRACATFASPKWSNSTYNSTTARWRRTGPRSTSHSNTRAAVENGRLRPAGIAGICTGIRRAGFRPWRISPRRPRADELRDWCDDLRLAEQWIHLMAIDYARLKAWPFPDVKQSYTAKDAILYALGIGLGRDPMNADELRFLYEDGLAVLPTFAVVLGYPGGWLRDPETGVDWKQVLHGEQELMLHRPLPPEGGVAGRTRVDEIIDKGAGKGALIY